MSKYEFNGQYFKLLDDSTEFICDWCGCNEFHLRGKLIVNLCDVCETLAIENNKYCNDVNEEIRISMHETNNINFKNVIIHPPEYYEEKLKNVEYSQYLKEKEGKDKVNIARRTNEEYFRDKYKGKINPITLKHNKKLG